jgi:hypothetical protein
MGDGLGQVFPASGGIEPVALQLTIAAFSPLTLALSPAGGEGKKNLKALAKPLSRCNSLQKLFLSS